MSYKKKISMVLLLFAAATFGAVLRDIVKSGGPAQLVEPQPETQPTVKQSRSHISVMYFLVGQKRCDLCRKMEAWTREAVDSQFAKQVADGEIKFELIDANTSENKHYRTDFELPFKTIVVAKYEDGKLIAWRRLDDLWTPARENNKAAFFAMIVQGVKAVSKDGDKK